MHSLAVLGIILSDIVHMVSLINARIPGRTDIGGAGVFDVTMIAGIVAVMVAELVGKPPRKNSRAALYWGRAVQRGYSK